MLNSQEQVNQPNYQIGVLDLIVLLLIAAEVKLFAQLVELGDTVVISL